MMNLDVQQRQLAGLREAQSCWRRCDRPMTKAPLRTAQALATVLAPGRFGVASGPTAIPVPALAPLVGLVYPWSDRKLELLDS